MADLVQFKKGSAAGYNSLTIDANTLYFITDTHQIYLGDTLMSGGVYEAVAALPETGTVNKLYVNTTDGSVSYWNGVAYQTVVKPQPAAIGDGSVDALATTKAVVDYVALHSTEDDVADIKTRLITAEGEIDTLQSQVATLNGDSTTTGSVAKAVADAKSALETEIAKKADSATTLAGYGITDAYTKADADTAIATAVAKADHLKREIVSELPAVASADANTIYMVGSGAGSESSSYTEYILINGAFERIGTSNVDLTDYAKSADVTSAIATAKSEAVSTAASDATTKADKALSDAKTYADGLAGNYATAAQGAKADSAVQKVATGSANGTIAVDGTDVSVKGLGSAAYTDSSAYDAAGAATTAQAAAVAAAKTETETQVAAAKTALTGTASDSADTLTLQGVKAYAKQVADSSTAAVDALDVTDTAVENNYVSAVSQENGKISVTRAELPVYSVAASTGTSNGNITLTVNGSATQVPVKGLGSAAYTESTAYATSAQGTKADSALQASDIATGTTNGTVSVKGTDVAVKGLGSAAYAKTTDFDASGAADAVLGTSNDASSKITVYGVKKYAEEKVAEVVAANALTWGTF